MKRYIIKTVEDRTYTGYYMLDANSEDEANELFCKGEGELYDEDYEETNFQEVIEVYEDR